MTARSGPCTEKAQREEFSHFQLKAEGRLVHRTSEMEGLTTNPSQFQRNTCRSHGRFRSLPRLSRESVGISGAFQGVSGGSMWPQRVSGAFQGVLGCTSRSHERFKEALKGTSAFQEASR